MVRTLLHVEDDPVLAEVVRGAFLAFGFTGEFISVSRARDAVDFIVRRRDEGRGLDLILLDMQLPDGSGLDVLRSVKANPAWAATPVIFLSSERNPEVLAEAYALGANCFVSKMPTDGKIFDALKSLYSCWFEAALLPPRAPIDPLGERLARAVCLRSRSGELYSRLARAFSGAPEIVGFWLDRALSESNLANLFAFLLSQSRGRRVDERTLERLTALQDDVERRLQSVERRLEAHPAPSPDEAYGWILDRIDAPHEEAFAEAMAVLFPIEPVAVRALKARFVVQLGEICAFIASHTGDAGLRAHALRLAATVERLNAPDLTGSGPTRSLRSGLA